MENDIEKIIKNIKDRFYEYDRLSYSQLRYLANDIDFNWLHIAAKNGIYSMLEQLLEHGINPNTLNLVGQTALQAVCELEPIPHQEVGLLLKFGADPNLAKNKKFPLLRAARKSEGNPELIMDLLLNAGAAIDASDKQGSTALHNAVYWRNRRCAEVLLKRGANVDAVDYWGETALHYAAQNRDKEMMKLLLRYDAQQIKNQAGYTPLGEFLD
jgi:ankyrin repeat protein